MPSSTPRSSSVPRRQVSVRTTPKLVPFLIGAVAVAFTVAIVVVYSTPQAENYDNVSAIGYMTFVFSIPALALSATLWLVIERLLRRRRETYDIQPLGDH